jgi:glycine cleavage system aminomethyltransferase T
MLKLLEGQKFQQQVIGFSLDGRVGLVEGHMVVYGMERLGYITSVSYSPTLNQTVGLALVKPHESFKEGGRVTLFLEGKDLKGRYVKPPFYDPKGERMRI